MEAGAWSQGTLPPVERSEKAVRRKAASVTHSKWQSERATPWVMTVPWRSAEGLVAAAAWPALTSGRRTAGPKARTWRGEESAAYRVPEAASTVRPLYLACG